MPNDVSLIPAGRDLDKLIAEMVFQSEVEVLNQRSGWGIDLRAKNNDCNDALYSDFGLEGYVLKKYSTSLEDAWSIVDKFGKQGTQWRFSNKALHNQYWWAYTEDATAQGDSLPHAICLAIIKHLQEQA